MASDGGGFFQGKLGSTIVLAVVSAAASLVAKQVITAWGVLDPISKWLGEWLKIHFSPDLTGWLLALIIFLLLLYLAMTFLARSQKIQNIHHKEAQTSSTPEPQVQVEFIPKKENDRRRKLIKAARDLAHEFNVNHRGENFHAFIQKQRPYLDIEPYLSDEYREQIRRDSGRSVVVTGDGSSYGCKAFLTDVARLEREWGIA